MGADVKFVVYNQSERDWRVHAVPVSSGSYKVPLHPDWCGLEEDELAQVSGFFDATFCHARGVVGGAQTYETAVKMAECTLAAAANVHPASTIIETHKNGRVSI